MPAQCNSASFDFAPIEGRAVGAGFDGGVITSDAGALLLGQADRGPAERTFCSLLYDQRMADSVATMVMQRIMATALARLWGPDRP